MADLACAWQEYCLQSLEFFVLAAPQDARAQFEAIFSTALGALAYDPNYTEAMEDDDEDEDAEEDECVPGPPASVTAKKRGHSAVSTSQLQCNMHEAMHA